MSDHVRYIDKTRDYYLAQGYSKPYQWARFDDVPFTRLSKPLSESRVALVSTSDVTASAADGTTKDTSAEMKVGNVYSIPTDTPIDRLYSRQEHYDKYATHLEDVNSYFPVSRLLDKVKEGRLAGMAPLCHGVYTSYSQQKTLEADAPEVLRRVRNDNVDVVVLTPV